MKIYVASSWRNERYPDVVATLRHQGHEVYDYRNPAPHKTGFHWQQIDPSPENPDARKFRHMLQEQVPGEAFALDKDALDACDACLLVLPCGASAHLEAGYAIGRGIPTAILLDAHPRPELMYRLAGYILVDFYDLSAWLLTIGGNQP
ncbi:MAG: hypothetical protein ACYC9Q_14975 [Bacillota bacterium]